ncbi:multidrug effflux MFS transporter [Zooshikella ganghwensis]|uniref:multidrug effflux MFS transporter n=1 Tax=Zooshikella ganghwensis TaxID=202772 RepID=UPI0003FCE012|nr:multidrug effflux MFS transporter [Zooshikella ganghwensis]
MDSMKDKFDILPVILLLSLLAGCIEVDMSIPSFPDIAAELNTNFSLVQMTIALNFVGFVLGALFYGPLSDSFGRRNVILSGSVVMLIGALGCVFSTSIEFLLLSRLIQGIGACAPVVVVFAIISDKYEGVKMYSLFGLVNAFMSIAMAIAPLVGGWVNYYLGWRGNYAIVALITFVSLIALFIFLPETKKEKAPINLRFLTESYSKLVFSSKFVISSLVPSLLFAAYMVFVASSAFLYRETFDLSVAQFVAHFFCVVVSFSITSLLSGRLITILGGESQTEKIGIFVAIFSMLMLAVLGNNPLMLTLFMSTFCIGFALLYPIVFGRSMSIFPQISGVASSFNMSTRSLLVVAATSLSSYLYNGEPQQMAYIMLGIALVAFVLSMMFYLQKDKVSLADSI